MDFEIFALQSSIDAERRVYNRLDQKKEEVIILPSKEVVKYEPDVKLLLDAFPDMKVSVENKQPYTLTISLQDLVQIVPRKRIRIDSYDSLRKLLRGAYNVELILTSRKTKA